jgi:hypothetical protein
LTALSAAKAQHVIAARPIPLPSMPQLTFAGGATGGER